MMNIKENISKLLFDSGLSNYKISKDTGIAKQRSEDLQLKNQTLIIWV